MTGLDVPLDLAVLFEKVEALLKAGVLPRAVVCSFPGLLPATKSILFRMFKGKQLAQVNKSPVADRIIFEAEVLGNGGRPELPPIDPENDLAVLQYTGGTTGIPKGAMLTHANLYVNVLQVAAFAPELETARHRVLAVLPFFHVFAMTVVLNFGVMKAAEMILMPRFVLEEAMELIEDLKPSILPGVPTLFNALMNHPRFASLDVSSLRYCLSGGAALPVEVKQRFEKLTGCKLVEGYGLSETSPVVTANPLEGPNKPGSIGLPVPGTIISLRDLADPTREVPMGERGELCVRGPQVMKGYWRQPEETANQMVDGFFRTGDVAVMDEDGYFYLVDRIKDLIISSGYNVYPRRIEEAIYQHPAVEEVSVIGIADERRGEAPKAFIKLKEGMSATAAEILAHLEPKLSRIEMPVEIEFRSELPKTLIGKPSKRDLKLEEADRRKAKEREAQA
nr:MAG: dicarboxylate--CoA ligase PimA [Pseudomonadota bacterium]